MKSTQFAKEIKKLMVDHDLNTTTLAEKMEVSKSYISSILCNRRRITDGIVKGFSQAFSLDFEHQTTLSGLAEEANRKFEKHLIGPVPAKTFAHFFNKVSCVKQNAILKQVMGNDLSRWVGE